MSLVYSTEHGSMCPRCHKPEPHCVCALTQPAPVGDGIVRVGRQTQGRKGKGVTVITGLALAPAELDRIARELKQRCGCGGTVKDGVIEIQGEQRDRLVVELQTRGYRVKRVG